MKDTLLGGCPGAVEGSAFDPDAVVAGRVDRGDHTAPGEQPGDTLTVGQLLLALDGLDAKTPVWLDVLGEDIDIEGVTIDARAVRIVGAEVVE